MDEGLKTTLKRIPLLTERAGPRDGERWVARLKQEYKALIAYMQMNKESDNDWFRLEANSTGTRWSGQCWYIHNYVKHQFDVHFEIPVTYPATPFEIIIPELEGLTAKMYRGGKICLTVHFKPLWAKNVPHFGIAHALAMGLAPWLATEVPDLVDKGLIDAEGTASSTAAASSADS